MLSCVFTRQFNFCLYVWKTCLLKGKWKREREREREEWERKKEKERVRERAGWTRECVCVCSLQYKNIREDYREKEQWAFVCVRVWMSERAMMKYLKTVSFFYFKNYRDAFKGFESSLCCFSESISPRKNIGALRHLRRQRRRRRRRHLWLEKSVADTSGGESVGGRLCVDASWVRFKKSTS